MKRFSFLPVFLAFAAILLGSPPALAVPTGASLRSVTTGNPSVSKARYHHRRYIRGRGPAHYNRRIDYCQKVPRRC